MVHDGTKTYQVWDKDGRYKGVRILTPYGVNELLMLGFTVQIVPANE